MRSTLAASLTALAVVAVPAVLTASNGLAAEKRELGSHEHGAATLQLAVEDDTVEIVLEVPGRNIVGFEHAPETDEQGAAVEEARRRLADPLSLFSMAGATGCTVAEAEVELHREGDHNAFEASYALSCGDAVAITGIGTTLLELYPTIERIEVEYATPAGQGAGELTADAPFVALPGTS